MQAYSSSFAQVYNQRWASFAKRIAPMIQAFYESTPLGQEHKTLLDLCCGTGQLAVHFVEQGYRVVGIDLSEPMLGYARDNAASHVQSGAARFVQADASHFSLDEHFGLVVSTYDAMNHLADESAMRSCFQCVYPVLEPGGLFLFDLNTCAGLEQWNSIGVEDLPNLMLVHRGFYDPESKKAWVRISGFTRRKDGLYERFEQTAYNTAFDLRWVRRTLVEIGWQDVHMARIEELGTPLADPEGESRVFFVARK
jgi:SAM-dependent methyltransferase